MARRVHSPRKRLSERVITQIRSPVWIFTGKFLLCTLLFFGLTLLPFWHEFLGSYLHFAACLSSSILNLVGEKCTASATTIFSDKYSLQIAENCSALEQAFFYTAAVVAFPAPMATMRKKSYGLLFGILILLTFNITRIVSLFLIGVHLPDFFDTAHVVFWPCLLATGTLLICVGWLQFLNGGLSIPLKSH